MHQRIYERPAEWNALRYKREYNHNLYTDLLFEEYSEYETAKTLVDKLDGLADIFFISIGALWKLGKSPYSYITYVHKQTLKYPSVAHARAERYTSAMPQIVHRILNLGESPQELEHLKKCICHLLDLLNYEFAYLGCAEADAELAIAIICDSNDTKLKGKLASGDKGSLKDPGYMPPTKRLKLLAEMIQNEEI